MPNQTPIELPIHEVLPQVVGAFRAHGQCVLVAPPGAGKTTGVPPAMLDAFPDGSRVLLLQPRRMAARAVATRLASLQRSPVGEQVGYQVRMDRRWGDQTRIVVMTYGVLLRRLQSDPLLEPFDTVLLDEFHERSLEADLALGMLHRVRSALRPDLRIGVMSATLEAAPVAAFLGDAPVVESMGRAYPVTIHYENRMNKERVEEQVAAVLPRAISATQGHILVFLPGVGEIRRTRRRISELASVRDCQVVELYGDLPPDAQDMAIAESNQRKIILSTNIAETSVTIPGVTGVIDSGLARVLRMHPEVGLPKLDLEPVSQASADQRAGRAGRTQPGVCFRLWMQAMQRSRPAYDSPEILRGDLAGAALHLYGWGESSMSDFPWLTPPNDAAIAGASALLEQLGAIRDGRITEPGRRMLTIPAHPRLSRLLLSAGDRGVLRRGAICAAMLSERDPFMDSRQGRISSGDAALMGLAGASLVDRVERLEKWIDGAPDPAIQTAAGRVVERTARQYLTIFRRRGGTDSAGATSANEEPGPDVDDSPNAAAAADEALSRALLDAFPDRLARARQPGSDRGLMVGGQGVRLKHRSATAASSLYLCIDLLQKSREADVSSAVPIDEDWLSGDALREVDECFFHPTQRRVVGRRRSYWLDLILAETPTEIVDRRLASEILAGQLASHWDRVFPADNPRLTQWIARVNALAAWAPEEGFACIDEEALRATGAELCAGCVSLDEVRQAPWLEHLRGMVGFETVRRVDQWAPERMRVPSGNEIAIEYGEGKPPQMSVRLQELFGWTETPRIAGGRQPLLLRLLAPNHREVQVTQDLASFWKSMYSEVRKELRRRYPKHHWPENPLEAAATRSGLGRDARARSDHD